MSDSAKRVRTKSQLVEEKQWSRFEELMEARDVQYYRNGTLLPRLLASNALREIFARAQSGVGHL